MGGVGRRGFSPLENPRLRTEAMPDPKEQDITRILLAVSEGQSGASEELLFRVYETLKSMARRQLASDRGAATVDATALVHEAWLRLFGGKAADFQHRAYFFGAAAQAMRRILVERARKAARARHGGDRKRVTLSGVEPEAASSTNFEEILALEGLLEELSTLDRRKYDVVMLRYYAGMTLEEIATALSISHATAKADWAFARSWLKSRLTDLDRS